MFSTQPSCSDDMHHSRNALVVSNFSLWPFNCWPWNILELHILALPPDDSKSTNTNHCCNILLVIFLLLFSITDIKFSVQCKNKLVVLITGVVTIVADKLETQWFALVLKTNCIRQPKRQLPTSFYNHNTLTTLRTYMRESPACIETMKAPNCNFEVHLY